MNIEKERIFTISKTFTFDYAHILKLPYESKCTNIHGHTAKLVVRLRSFYLNNEGMVIDFTHLKKKFGPEIDRFDHALVLTSDQFEKYKDFVKDLKIVEFEFPQTSAEYFAVHFYNKLSELYPKYEINVEFFETPNNSATFGDF